MNLSIRFHQNIITFGLPLMILFSSVMLSQSSWLQQHPESLSNGIILDLTLTVPLVYLFLIRKQDIPKTTAVPFFILGIVVASYIIPADHQSLLDKIKTWIVPVVELTVFFFVALKVRKIHKSFKHQKQSKPDFYSMISRATQEILPKKASVLLATEIAVIYYGFFNWKKHFLAKNEFSYHKNTGTIAILSILIVIILVETFVLHLLLQRWSPIAAWILSIASLYSAFQIFGMLKSLSKRPISIENGKLELRYGFMCESTIPLEHIDSVELSSKQIAFDSQTRKLSPLGDLEGHNVLIHLKKENPLRGLYGKKMTFKIIALYMDDKKRFKQELDDALELK